MRGSDALPRARVQRGQALLAGRRLAEGDEDRRAARESSIVPQRGAQLELPAVREAGGHDNQVRLGGTGALPGMVSRALGQDRVPRILEQAHEPARAVLFGVDDER